MSYTLEFPELQRVLIVDDEPDSIEVVKMVLLAAGADVLEASDGREGLELTKSFKPTLILSDISMPEVDGWEFMKSLQDSGCRGNATVIALTAHAMVGDEEKVLAAGFDGYLSKPINMFELLDNIRNFITEKVKA